MLPLHIHQKKSVRIHWNANNILTLVCAGLSLLLIAFGSGHCYKYGYNYVLDCNKDLCVHKSSVDGIPLTQFPRDSIVGAETVRVNGVEVVDTSVTESTAAEISQLGYSFIIKYTDRESKVETENIKSLLFTPHNLGKRIAKARTHEIHDFAEGFIDKVRINQGRHLTSFGALLVFVGFLCISMVDLSITN